MHPRSSQRAMRAPVRSAPDRSQSWKRTDCSWAAWKSPSRRMQPSKATRRRRLSGEAREVDPAVAEHGRPAARPRSRRAPVSRPSSPPRAAAPPPRADTLARLQPASSQSRRAAREAAAPLRSACASRASSSRASRVGRRQVGGRRARRGSAGGWGGWQPSRARVKPRSQARRQRCDIAGGRWKRTGRRPLVGARRRPRVLAALETAAHRIDNVWFGSHERHADDRYDRS